MSKRLSSIHPLSWPLWVKFMIGIAIGLALLAVPAYLFVRSGIFDISEQSAQSFVAQIGVKQATAVSAALAQARTSFNNFTSDEDNITTLTGFLLRNVHTDSPTYLPQASAEQINELFRSNLLNPATAEFDSITLLDRNGQQLIETDTSTTSFGPVDQSQSPAYRAIQSAQIQSQSSTMVVSAAANPVVQMINTITWRDGTPIGYVIATLSDSRIFIDNIRVDSNPDNYTAYTFLTTLQNVLIAPPAAHERAASADQSDAVTKALAGSSGSAVYSAKDGVQYIGYYAPISGTPFVLVTQAPADVVYASALNFFQVRVFVVGGGVLVLLVLLALIFSQITVPPLYRLRRATQALSDGDFEMPVPDARRGDEIGMLAASFVNMREQVHTLIEDLENRVAARTRDISATQDISRYAATQRDLQTLMERVVDLIVERFPNIYHAQIFLIDDDHQDAVLRASTGEAGKQLLSRGHRLGIGSLSVIGQVTQQGRLIVARDASVSQMHRRNEFLPETRAEVAIPLRVGETIIGALDVQSKIRDTFDDDQINVLQTMADQIAVAIQNARLYQESIRRFAEVEASNRDATRRAWQEFMRDQRMNEIVREAGFPTTLDVTSLRQRAIDSGEAAIGQVTERETIPIAVPVQLRGQVLGAIEWEIPAQTLSEEKIELAKELANRLALSLDNARLFQESQRATERERLVNNIAAKLTAQTTINDILQTAVREVGQALRAPQVSIRLNGSGHENGNGNGNGHSNGNGNGHSASGGNSHSDGKT
ncbi:MAG TPA: GAF domain-containing protein [Phototrophicaceae bacterium]|nr:GAF domain-containing protein [Phototrophicaceae bacterium]